VAMAMIESFPAPQCGLAAVNTPAGALSKPSPGCH
jgi:hypothetical protein